VDLAGDGSMTLDVGLNGVELSLALAIDVDDICLGGVGFSTDIDGCSNMFRAFLTLFTAICTAEALSLSLVPPNISVAEFAFADAVAVLAGGPVSPNIATAESAGVPPLVGSFCPNKSLADVEVGAFVVSCLLLAPTLPLTFPLDCPKKLDAFTLAVAPAFTFAPTFILTFTLTGRAGEAALTGTGAGEAALAGTGVGALTEDGGTFPNKLDAFAIFPEGSGDDDLMVGGNGDADLIGCVPVPTRVGVGGITDVGTNGTDADTGTDCPNISAADLTDLAGDG
jgi:hypothetical protein